jgi:2-dehydropantoate 2-reductase
VAFIARGGHLAAMRRDGLRVLSPLGDVHVPHVEATDDPADIGPVDIVLFCVKLYDTESAGRRLAPLIGPETAVVSLQNGVDSEDALTQMLGPRHVVGGVAYISATIDAPGVIRHLNHQAKLIFGEIDGRPSARLERLRAACAGAGGGIVAEMVPDIGRLIWEKFVFLASLAAATGVTRAALGPILADGDMRAMMIAAMREVVAVAAARGVRLAPDLVERNLTFAATLPATMKASLAYDLERGNRIELDGLMGAVVRLGEAAGVPTPVQRTIYAALKPYRDGRAAVAPA